MVAPLVRARALSFAYPSSPEPLFEELSFHLSPGFTGLVGPNGAGKSTLLSLLVGELQPDTGSISIEPDWVWIERCDQRVEICTEELRAFALASDAEAHRLRGLLNLSPTTLERWETCSPGERRRWQIGAALHASPEILLLDEPTNHLDHEARSRLLEALESFRGVGILVSHDRDFLDALTASTLRLDHGTGALYTGNYSKARASWEAEEEARRQHRERLKTEERSLERRLDTERREQAAASRQINASRRMKDRNDSDARSALARGRAEYASARLGQRSSATRTRLSQVSEERAGLRENKETRRPVFLGYEPPPRPRLLSLDVPQIQAGERLILGPTRLWLDRGARVWMEGSNGAGKSTLMRSLLAASTLPPERLLYLPQELSEAETEALVQLAKTSPAEQRGRTLAHLAALGCEPEQLLASASPSPGEARKLALALGLSRHAWLLALDEPTNHLDLPSVEQLENALEGYPGALLLITHDRRFGEALTKERWRIADGQVHAR